MKWNRLPVQPLLDRIPVDVVWHGNTPSYTGGAKELARRLGIQPKMIWRWAQDGLDEYVADRMAFRLGYHPTDIWGDLWRIVCVEPEPEPMFAGRHWSDGVDRGECAEDCDARCRIERRRLAHRADNASRRLREAA